MTATFKLRRDTAANWTSATPTLAAGEPGLETDTLKWKVGDGATAWTSLAYFNPGGGASFATPTVALGSAAAAGAASTVIRSDSTIAAFDTTVPSTQAFGDAAAVGTAAFAARRDHKHAMPANPTLGLTVQVPLALVVPDSTGNAYPLLVAGSVHRHLIPAFLNDVVGSWFGVIRVPLNYSGTPKVILSIAANATSGVSSLFVATAKAADTVTYNPAAYTVETTQDITVPATAYLRKDVTFTITLSGITAGDDLMVKVCHSGTDANDTLAVPTLLPNIVFQYAT